MELTSAQARKIVQEPPPGRARGSNLAILQKVAMAPAAVEMEFPPAIVRKIVQGLPPDRARELNLAVSQKVVTAPAAAVVTGLSPSGVHKTVRAQAPPGMEFIVTMP